MRMLNPSTHYRPATGRAVARRRGVALITVLLLLALITSVIVSFFVVVKADRLRSRSFLNAMRSRLMLETALEEAMAKIMDGSEIPWTTDSSADPSDARYRALGSMTASPGLMQIRYFDSLPERGQNETGADAFGTNSFLRNPFFDGYNSANRSGTLYNPRWIPLFSHRIFAPAIRWLSKTGPAHAAVDEPNAGYNPALQFNINTIQNPFFPGELYLSGSPDRTVGFKFTRDASGRFAGQGSADINSFRYAPGESSYDRPVYVQWLPIHEDPSKPPGTNNKVIGRYAYWIDVENTKVNLNAARRLYDYSELAKYVGVSDDSTNWSSGSYFTQTDAAAGASPKNDSLLPRFAAEGETFKDYTFNYPFNTSDTNQFATVARSALLTGNISNRALSTYHQLLLGWGNGRATASGVSGRDDDRPYVADNSMVDWRTFTGMRPLGDGSGEDVSTEDLSFGYDALDAPFNTPYEVFSLQDPKVADDQNLERLQFAAMRRTYGLSTTIFGQDDERDPIGKPKIDIARFQTNAIGSTTWNALRRRLALNANYFSAYYPRGYPTGGAGRSLAQSLSWFAGRGDGTTADGQAVIDQMLVNIIASGKPHGTAPEDIPGFASLPGGGSTSRGIWPALSMPYVTEVATRARSAFHLIPAITNNPPLESEFFETNIISGNAVVSIKQTANYRGTTRDNLWYLSNALVDLAFAFANPNPFATNTFNGEFTPTINGTNTTGITARTLAGNYHVSFGPEVNNTHEQAAIYAPGQPIVYTNIAGDGIPARTLLEDKTWLKIAGWTIRSGGKVMHQVPMKHLGASASASAAVPWWQMAATNYNAGNGGPGSLSRYATNGGIAVGWFTPETLKASLTYIADTNVSDASVGLTNTMPGGAPLPVLWAAWSEITPGQTNTNVINGVRFLLTNSVRPVLSSAVVERVQCIDPTVGHRTINTLVSNGRTNAGHFYGTMGHPWRHHTWSAPSYTPPSTRTVGVSRPGATNSLSVPVRVPVGNGYQTIFRQVNVVTSTTDYNVVLTGGQGGGMTPSLTARFQDARETTNWTQYLMTGSQLWEPALGVNFIAGNTPGPSDKEMPGGYLGNTGAWNTIGFASSGPRGDLMTSIGEIGFIHSGLLQRPINLTTRTKSSNTNCIDHPALGPPMRMLVDMFTPPRFRLANGNPVTSEATWRSTVAGQISNTPDDPRIGTWNLNTGIASDAYMTVREGDPTTAPESNYAYEPDSRAGRVIWAPNAVMKQRSSSSEGEEAEPPLDTFLSPFPRYRRGWDSWLSVIGGDFTPTRSLGEGAWSSRGNPTTPTYLSNIVGYLSTPLPAATWSPGRGVVQGTPYFFGSPLVNFDPDYDPTRTDDFGGPAGLLALGADGRDPHGGAFDNDGKLKGTAWAADDDLDNVANNAGGNATAMFSSLRYSIMPLKHFTSELDHDTSGLGRLSSLRTALNAVFVVADGDGNGGSGGGPSPAGIFSSSGILNSATVAMAANQVSTSANAFTIHMVAQSLQDIGKKRKRPDGTDDPNSGVGHIDFDDRVTAEQWGRVVVGRSTVSDSGSPLTTPPRNYYRVLYYRLLQNPK